MTGLKFKSNGKCHLVVDENFAEEILHVPEENPEGDKVVSIYVKSRVKKIFLPATIESVTEHDESGAKIIFRDGLKSVSEDAFYNVYEVTFPASLTYIDEDAFEFDEYSCCPLLLHAPKNSVAHRLAVKKAIGTCLLIVRLLGTRTTG